MESFLSRAQRYCWSSVSQPMKA